MSLRLLTPVGLLCLLGACTASSGVNAGTALKSDDSDEAPPASTPVPSHVAACMKSEFFTLGRSAGNHLLARQESFGFKRKAELNRVQMGVTAQDEVRSASVEERVGLVKFAGTQNERLQFAYLIVHFAFYEDSQLEPDEPLVEALASRIESDVGREFPERRAAGTKARSAAVLDGEVEPATTPASVLEMGCAVYAPSEAPGQLTGRFLGWARSGFETLEIPVPPDATAADRRKRIFDEYTKVLDGAFLLFAPPFRDGP